MYQDDLATQRRFWAKVKPSTTNFWNGSACLEWQGWHDLRYGRPIMRFNKKHVKAYRYAFDVFKEPIKPGMLVCHHCDNPKCVNPAHLFQGTYKDNTQDCIKKGRQRLKKGHKYTEGILNGHHKLTEEQVKQIRKEYVYRSSTAGSPALGLKYGVSGQVILDIVRRATWAHIL